MSLGLGFVAAAVSVVCFGSYAVPVGLSPVGDGIFFQWVQCGAILIVGLIAQLAFGGAPSAGGPQFLNVTNATICLPTVPYQFEPIAMVGGMLWTIGNCTVIPIVGMIGLGLGMLLWGLANMVVGWLIGTVGIFIKPQLSATPALNYAGLAVAAASFVLYFFVKVEKKEGNQTEENLPLVTGAALETNAWEEDKRVNAGSGGGGGSSSSSSGASSKGLSDVQRKIFGVLLSVGAGVCYGFNMTPVTYLQQQYCNASPFLFAFSHFCGIFFTSTVIMLGYAILKRGRPYVDGRSVLGGLFAGTLWGVAQCAWFAANANLGTPVSFPIIATGPGIVANLWGIFLFKEIKGKANLLKLIGAFLVTLTGIILIALSKISF